MTQLRAEVTALAKRVTQQEDRLDNLSNKMDCNHHELMMTLRSLSLGSDPGAASSVARKPKRSSDLPATPLKDATGARAAKEARA